MYFRIINVNKGLKKNTENPLFRLNPEGR